MNKVVFFANPSQITDAIKHFDVAGFKDESIPIKLHMGEMKNKYFTKPDFVKRVVELVKTKGGHPFLTDTTVAYNALRKSVTGYKKVAHLHGFTKKKMGCEVIIDDHGAPIEVEGRRYDVADHLHTASYIVALSHVKGHVATGMGGAIKNFGMGGVTKETKRRMHHGARPVHQKDACTLCGVCAELCPFDAISVSNESWKKSKRKCFGCGVCVDVCEHQGLQFEDAHFQFVLACACKACVDNKNVLYINDVNRIAQSCDCDPFAGPPIAPDIGYLMATDPVAIDAASLELIHQEKERVFQKVNHVDPWKQIHFGEDIGLGTTQYTMIKI